MYIKIMKCIQLNSVHWHHHVGIQSNESNMIHILSCLVSLWLNTISLRVVGCPSHVRVHRPSLDNTLCVQEI